MKQVAQHKDNSDSVLTYGGYSFLFIKNLTIVPIEEVQFHSAVIIECKNLDFVRLMISSIRSNSQPDIYLKPIFLLKRKILSMR